jgi:spermidine/putrescine transport system permease protein
MTNDRKNRLRILLSLPVVWLVGFFLIPLGIMVLFSVREGTFTPVFPITFKHYVNFFQTPDYLRLLADTTWIAALTALITVLLAYPLAYYLVFSVGARKMLMLSFLVLPAWTSYLLRILAWKVMLSSNGVINTFLIAIGLVETGEPIFLYSQTAVIITLVYVWIPYAALPVFSSLERVDPKVIEASQDLGATPFQTFFRVTFPMSISGVVAGFFFVFVPTLGEWVTPALVGGVDGIMYGNLIQNQFLRGLNWPMGTVMSMVLLVLVGAMTLLFNRYVTMSDISSVA